METHYTLPLGIIGIDPGTTAAYAILRLDGSVIETYSSKELALGEMIQRIFACCRPILVGTDKAKIPSFVDEFGRKSGAVVVNPTEDLQREEKRLMLKEYTFSGKTQHEDDALAAALFTFQQYHSRLEKIKHYCELHHVENQDEFTVLALKTALSFPGIENLLKTPTAHDTALVKNVLEKNKVREQDVLILYEKNLGLTQENKRLKNALATLQKSWKDLGDKNRYLERTSARITDKVDSLLVFKEERVKKLQLLLKQAELQQQQLRKKIQQTHTFIGAMMNKNNILVKKMDTLSKKEFIVKKSLLLFSKGDIIFVKNTHIHSDEVLNEFVNKNVFLLSPTKISTRVQKILPTIQFEEPFLLEEEYFGLFPKELVVNSFNLRVDIEKVLTDYREREN